MSHLLGDEILNVDLYKTKAAVWVSTVHVQYRNFIKGLCPAIHHLATINIRNSIKESYSLGTYTIFYRKYTTVVLYYYFSVMLDVTMIRAGLLQ